jgi:hypothetical protein
MSNTITPTVFYRTLNMEGLEILSIVHLRRQACDVEPPRNARQFIDEERRLADAAPRG